MSAIDYPDARRMRLDVEFYFTAAHRLPRYDGPCNRVHGHNYKFFVALEGEARCCGEVLGSGELLYLPPGGENAVVQAAAATRLLVVGGAPFGDELVMWWNFVGRNRTEIARFVADWNAGRAFGEVRGYAGERTLAPPPRWAS